MHNKKLKVWHKITNIFFLPVLRIRSRIRTYVFGPSESWSISTRYGSESGSLYYQAKIVRKTLIPTSLPLCDFFMTFLPLEKWGFKEQKNRAKKKKIFLVVILKVTDENSRIRSRSRVGSGSESGSVSQGYGLPKCYGSATLVFTTSKVKLPRQKALDNNVYYTFLRCW